MSRGETHVYSPQNVVVALGNHIPSGYAADGFISIAELGDGVADEAGADGEVVVSISNDPRFEVKFVFQYGSSTNDYLLNLYKRNKQSPGSGFIPILIRDLGDNPKFTASTAWITKAAGIAYGAKGGNQEWTFHCIGELDA